LEREELLQQYEARGDVFVEAKRLYEQALEEMPDATLLTKYGYLLECHGRFSIRKAVGQYERSIDLDPSDDQTHYQLIGAYAGLREPQRAIALYQQRLATSPRDLREHRFLAYAYLAGHEDAEARGVVDAGLELAPEDSMLIEFRGDVRAGTGDPDGALADWRRAHELNPESLSSIYSSAFLLEREGQLEEAVEAWRFIIEWCDLRGFAPDVEWPKREIERLRASG